VGHVAYVREKRNAYGVLMGTPEGMKPFKGTGIFGKALEWIFKK
jgi:hypothetical protein